jgi:P4 family phage/plasmid primase-like protien
MKGARTANEVADRLFPVLAKDHTAFVEKTTGTHDSPVVQVVDLHDAFWISTVGLEGGSPTPIVFSLPDNCFRRYSLAKGIYEPTTESAVVSEILHNLDLTGSWFPERVNLESLLAIKTRSRIKAMMESAKDVLAWNESMFRDYSPGFLAFENGIYDLNQKVLKPFSPSHPIRETLPVKYAPEAKCELFLTAFLKHILSPDDIDLLQRYCSQILLGTNHSQTLLVLTGESGWGKSSLMKILGNIIGWNRVGIVREQLFKDPYELSHYQNKRLLYHPDMPTTFLDRPEASIFKQLVGGDPLWADVKGGDERMTLEGNYPIILACNGKPKIHLDEDTEAWTRRMVVLSFKKPQHETHLGKMSELIMKEEASGVLNWLLQGWAKLWRDKMQLLQNQEQKQRSAKLLLSSESPKAFVRTCIKQRKGSIIWMGDIYGEYQKWCRKQSLQPFTSRDFMNCFKGEIEMGFGLRPRQDLIADSGTARRGWPGLVVEMGMDDPEQAPKAENWSVLSE